VYRAGKDALSIARAAAIAALLTIVVALGFALVPGIDACGPGSSWVAFQKVDSPNAVSALIAKDCAAVFVPALRASMWLDALVFIPVYTAFLALTLAMLGPVSRALWLATIAMLAIGVVADQIEGFRLLALLDRLPGTAETIVQINRATVAKEFCLSIATALIGVGLATKQGWRRAIGIGVLLTATANGLNTLGIGAGGAGLLIAWLALAVTTFFLAWKGKPADDR
jgi:hypothetical protein